MTSRAAILKAAIDAVLDHEAAMVDAISGTVTAIVLTVQYDQKTGLPGKVALRPEVAYTNPSPRAKRSNGHAPLPDDDLLIIRRRHPG